MFLLILMLAVPVDAQSKRGGGERVRSGPGTGNPTQHLAPWRIVQSGTEPVTSPLVLYWLPASLEELDHSPLLSSQALLDDSFRCVALEAVVPPNEALAGKLGVTGVLPAAVLVDRHGNVVRRAGNTGGVLQSPAVEEMVGEEFRARDEAMYRDITEARRQGAAGDKKTAIDLYRRIWDDRCLFPFAGKEARTALSELGVVVQEMIVPPPVDPNLSVPPAGGRPGEKPQAGSPKG